MAKLLKRNLADISSDSDSDEEERVSPKTAKVDAKTAKIETKENGFEKDSKNEANRDPQNNSYKPKTSAVVTKGTDAIPKQRNSENQPKKPASISHWSQGLQTSMTDAASIVDEDDTIVVIRDKFPKARNHFLVLPKDASYRNLHVLRKDERGHTQMLRHMREKGAELAKRLKAEDPQLKFRLGYHASPSMSPLHLHVISQDFDSPCLKHKKHWNSFTTDFFREATAVEAELAETGEVAKWDPHLLDALLKTDLKCHECREPFKTIPALKSHLKKHVGK